MSLTFSDEFGITPSILFTVLLVQLQVCKLEVGTLEVHFFLTLWWLKILCKFSLIDGELKFVSLLTETYFHLLSSSKCSNQRKCTAFIGTWHSPPCFRLPVYGFSYPDWGAHGLLRNLRLPLLTWLHLFLWGGLWNLILDNKMWNRPSGTLP